MEKNIADALFVFVQKDFRQVATDSVLGLPAISCGGLAVCPVEVGEEVHSALDVVPYHKRAGSNVEE